MKKIYNAFERTNNDARKDCRRQAKRDGIKIKKMTVKKRTGAPKGDAKKGYICTVFAVD